MLEASAGETRTSSWKCTAADFRPLFRKWTCSVLMPKRACV